MSTCIPEMFNSTGMINAVILEHVLLSKFSSSTREISLKHGNFRLPNEGDFLSNRKTFTGLEWAWIKRTRVRIKKKNFPINANRCTVTKNKVLHG